MEDDQPQFVQDLTETQGVAIAIQGESVEDTGQDFWQFYGNRELCELFDEDVCSHDGNLWGTGDMGSPYTCTAHTFPLEQTGYEFVSKEQ